MDANVAFIGDWQRSKELLDAFPVGMVICGADGTIVHTNSETWRLFGYSEGELLGQPIDMLLPEEIRSEHQGHFLSYLKNPSKRIMGFGRDLHARRKDGSVFLVEIGLNPLVTAEGMQVVATVSDISPRYRLESNFRSMVEAAPVGMLMVGEDGRIQHANKQLQKIFGYTVEELKGQPMEMLLPDRHRTGHPAQRQAYMGQPSTRSMGLNRDLTGLHKSGVEIPVEIGLNPIETEQGRVVIATVSDISERKKMELKLKALNADLDEFTYVASHDLRSPLRGISNLVEWIEEDLGENVPESMRGNLERIHVRVERMEKLVDDLLAYARSGRQETDVTSINLQRMIENVVQFVDPPAGFNVILHVNIEKMRGALTPLETVLRNLISNSIKHHDRDRGEIRVSVAEDDSFCMFDVEDDGPGIPPIAHERVFKLFQALSNKDGSRSGVGLAVCKRLVEAHGGRIELHSSSDTRGTRFRFWWPRFERRDIND